MCKVCVLNVCLLNYLVKKHLLPTQELLENLLPASKHGMMPSLLLRLLLFTAHFNIFVYLAKSRHVWWNVGHPVNSAWIKLLISLHWLISWFWIRLWIPNDICKLHSGLAFIFFTPSIYSSLYHVLITSMDHAEVVPVLFLTN